jgi:hypothetical protein
VGTQSFIDPYVFDSSTYSLSSPVTMNDVHITASLCSALATHVSLFPTVSQDDNKIVPAWSWRSSHETSKFGDSPERALKTSKHYLSTRCIDITITAWGLSIIDQSTYHVCNDH